MLVDPCPFPGCLFTDKMSGAVAHRFIFLHRNRIVAMPTPGMATRETAQAEPTSGHHAAHLDRLQKIGRTSRFKSATRTGSADRRQDRRERALISANKKASERKHQRARIEARSARRNHSSFRS